MDQVTEREIVRGQAAPFESSPKLKRMNRGPKWGRLVYVVLLRREAERDKFQRK